MQTAVLLPNLPALLNEFEAANILGLSPRTLQALRVKGGGPKFLKLRRSVRYRPADLEAFIAAGERNSTSQTGAAQ